MKIGDIIKDIPTEEILKEINEKGFTLEKIENSDEGLFQYKIVVPKDSVEVDGKYRPMTNDEKLENGIITREEYNSVSNNLIIQQIRAIEETDEYKRKLRLAMTGDTEAKEWLSLKEDEIQSLRDNLKN